MKKMKTGIGVMLALLCCILMCTGVVYATGDDTDGTELQVAQPVILEVQLGPQWVGVEFQLKTDAGLYPGTIAVGQDGILRTEAASAFSALSVVSGSCSCTSEELPELDSPRGRETVTDLRTERSIRCKPQLNSLAGKLL